MLAAPSFACSIAQAAGRAISLRAAIGADAAIFFETRGLPSGAFLLRLRRSAVALALAFAALAVLCER